MGLWDIIVMIVVGALVGWLAGIIMKSKGSLLRNIICGILGGALGGWISSILGITFLPTWLLSGIFSIIGACIIIFIANLIFKKK